MCVWVCFAAMVVCAPAIADAMPQEGSSGAAPSLSRLKRRLDAPLPPRLTPSTPVQLRPRFRTRVIDRPFVPTLEEHLRETFALTDFQRQYAVYAARCCGLDLGGLVKSIDRALDERRDRQIREQIASELALLEAARAKQERPRE
jgi:hypothetical protein